MSEDIKQPEETTTKRAPRRPLIGSGRALQQMESEAAAAAVMVDTLGRSAEEKGLSDEEVIEKRTAERDQIVKQITPAAPEPPVLTVTPLGARLDQIATAQRDATKDARAVQVAEAEKLARPLLATAHRLSTAIGLLRSKHTDVVVDAARRPWADILRALPNTMQHVERPAPDAAATGADREADGLAGQFRRPEFISARFFVSEFARVARALDGALANTFPDLVEAANKVAQFVGRGPSHRGADSDGGDILLAVGTHDPMYSSFSTDFKLAIRHLGVQIERAQNQLATTERLVGLFATLQEKTEAVLTNVVIEPAALPPRVALPLQPAPAPQRDDTTSFVDYDPRDPSTFVDKTPPAPPQVRMGDASEREKKVIGIVLGNQS